MRSGATVAARTPPPPVHLPLAICPLLSLFPHRGSSSLALLMQPPQSVLCSLNDASLHSRGGSQGKCRLGRLSVTDLRLNDGLRGTLRRKPTSGCASHQYQGPTNPISSTSNQGSLTPATIGTNGYGKTDQVKREGPGPDDRYGILFFKLCVAYGRLPPI